MVAELFVSRSSCRTIADPTMTPSASPRSVPTCSGLLTPKPTASGRFVLPRRRLSWPESSSGSWSLRRSCRRLKCSTRSRCQSRRCGPRGRSLLSGPQAESHRDPRRERASDVARFVGRQIGNDESGEASGLRAFHETRRPNSEDDGVADHRDQRRDLVTVGAARELLDAGENVVDVQAARQGSRVAGLNHWAVSDRVAVRKADFDEVDASAGEFANRRHRRRDVGITDGDERHEGHVALSLQSGERGGDASGFGH